MKTVIVLGAGASHPYGLPLGNELRNHFLGSARNTMVANRLQNMGFDPLLLKDLIDVLEHSHYETIDHFLESKKRFRDIGGCIIAEALLSCENKQKIFPKRGWYDMIYKKLYNNILNDKNFDLTFVTLNYDRSLEYFLNNVSRYNCDEDKEDQVRERLAAVPVIHVHGSLGNLGELSFGNESGNNIENAIRVGASKIRIVSDKIDKTEAFKIAKDAVIGAERIIILGFGYHPATLESLFSNFNPKLSEIRGTALNLDSNRFTYATSWLMERGCNKVSILPVDSTNIIGQLNI